MTVDGMEWDEMGMEGKVGKERQERGKGKNKEGHERREEERQVGEVG